MPDDMNRVRWNRHTQNFTIVQARPPARVFNQRPNMIHGQHQIQSTAYNEIVYRQPPPKAAYNNRFFKMNPVNVFQRSVEDTDPISGTHSAFWGTIGKYIQIGAKPRAIHINFVTKSIPDRALKILVTRIMEHTHSNQVLNPRLLVVFKRKGKKVISMILNAHQLRNTDSDRLTTLMKRAMRNSKHFILKQDNPGGHFHDLIERDEILV